MTAPVLSPKTVNRLRASRVMVELAIAALGIAIVLGAAAANQRWLDRHFLPSFIMPRDWYVRIETAVRIGVAAFGAALALILRRPLTRLFVETPMQAARLAIAVLLALGASEAVLRRVHVRPGEWLVPAEEPRRQPDARLGWTLVPGRTGHLSVGGRSVDYVIDASGYRVRRVDEPVNPAPPTVVFIGESIVFGEGLRWDESIPAQVMALTGVQSANLAVNGYSNDQAFLRLQQELPRFQHPEAVVSLFMPVLFGRNLDDDRPHLGPGLSWEPATPRMRLSSLARLLVPYRSRDEIDRGVTLTREVLRATADLARSRGAASMVVVPHIGPEDEREAAIRRRVLDEGGLAYLRVDLDAQWHVPSDEHPDSRGARAIASAIAAQLTRR